MRAARVLAGRLGSPDDRRRPSPLRGGSMSVRQRVLRSAPLIAFGLAIVFLGLSLGGYDPADPPGHGAEPVNAAAGQSLRPGRRAAAPTCCSRRSAGRRGCCSPALAGRQPAPGPPPAGPRPARPGDRLRAGRWSSPPASIHKLAPALQPSPPVGSGGYVGALVAIFLEASLRHRRHDPHPRRDRAVRAGALP